MVVLYEISKTPGLLDEKEYVYHYVIVNYYTIKLILIMAVRLENHLLFRLQDVYDRESIVT
jgi:hypothetical protein